MMVDQDPAVQGPNFSAPTSIGVLIIVGLVKLPSTVINAIARSEHVKNVETRRSGTQIELTLELIRPATISHLKVIAEELDGYDVIYQGNLSRPYPTLIANLKPVKRSNGFLRGRLKQIGSKRIGPSSDPTHDNALSSSSNVQPLTQSEPSPLQVSHSSADPLVMALTSFRRLTTGIVVKESTQLLTAPWNPIRKVVSIGVTLLTMALDLVTKSTLKSARVPVNSTLGLNALLTITMNSVFGSRPNRNSKKKSENQDAVDSTLDVDNNET